MSRLGNAIVHSVAWGLVFAATGCAISPQTTTEPPPPAPAPVVEAPSPPPSVPVPVAPPPPPQIQPVANQPFLYKLWYATNRTPVSAKGEVVDYSQKWDAQHIHYGQIYAEIPEDFLKQNSKTGFFDRLFRTSEAKLRLTKPNETESAAFVRQLKSHLNDVPVDERQILIYLHGFNTTFKEAAQRAASIGYQLKMPTTAFFSWPSQGGIANYWADKDLAELSQDSIADFILKAHAESGANRIHLIAHSMGNYALLGAMYRPKMQRAIANGLRFGQIILAAPDVDTEKFKKDAAIFSEVAERVSLYVSDGDKALNMSKKVAAGRARAGLRPPIVVVKNIDTVDVSSTNLTLLGHSFVSAEVSVLSDMHSLILHNEPPAKRSRINKKNDYWELQ